jgi:probable F420-dependent oxidoreductase
MNRPFKFAVRSSQTGSGREWRDKARQVEDLGYYAWHMSDHVMGPGEATERTGHPPTNVAVVPGMMAIAAATERLRIGSRVMCMDYHHPVVLVRDAATIDLLSDGRLELGLGAGWLVGEYEAIGIPFDPAPTRIERLGELVALAKLLFADGPVSFRGKHFYMEGFEGSPRPVQKPHPPIAIGGGSRRVLQLAARVADIVSFNYDNRSGVLGAAGIHTATAARTAEKVAWVHEAAGDRIDDIQLEIGTYFNVLTDDAVGTAERLGGRFGLTVDEMLSHPHALIGSIDGICEELERRREAYGISYFTVGADMAEPFAPIVERLSGK